MSKLCFQIRPLLCGLGALILTGSSLTAAEISAIRFEQEGKNPIPTEMLSVTMRLRPGMEYKKEYLDQDIKSLYDSGKVSDVAAEIRPQPDGKVELLFKLRPSPIISTFRIVGNKKFSTKDLQGNFTIADGDRLSSRHLQETIDNLRKFYAEKGYSDLRIEPPAVIPDGKGGVIVTLTIEENLRYKVNDVNFEGVKAFKPRELRKILANKYSYWNLLPFINNFLNQGLLQRDELELDKARLRELYHNKGYLDFKVSDIVLTPTAKDPEFVDLLFKIEEGEPYTVDQITIEGTKEIAAEQVKPLLPKLAGKTYSAAAEQASVRAIGDLYDNRGYSDAAVRVTRSTDFPTHKVSLRYQVTEGRKYRVNEVILNGNTATQSKVLLRELAIQPGDPVAKNRISISKQRLLGMGYFKNVEIDAVNADDLDAKDIRITVEEKPERYNFRIGAGASDVNKLFGMAEISTSNFDIANPKKWFYGGGQRLRLQGIYGVERAGFNIDFVEPWLLDLPLRFELSGYMNTSEYDDWDEDRIGVRTSLQRKIFDDFTTVTVGYKFEVVKVGAIDNKLKEYFSEHDWDGTSRVSQPSLMLGRDTRDSLVDPTEGYNVNLFGSITPKYLGSSDDYYRFELKGSYYKSFFDKAVVAMVGAKFGVVSAFSINDDVPVFERYMLGGSNSLRGFDYRSVGKTVNGKNVGGQTMLILTAEVSHPIWGPLRGAAFVDAGNAWDSAYQLNIKSFNIGVGYGFRLKLPMIQAPLKLDLAYPVLNNQDDESSKFRIHFNVGVSF